MKIFGYQVDMDKIHELVITYGMKLIIGIIILIVGLWIIKLVVSSFKKILVKRDVDVTLIPFLVSLISVTLKIMLFISVVTYFGVSMTSFVAILGAAGLAVGMALSGTLQNFAGGVVLLILRPFRVGDFIEAQGYMGTVQEIQIFNTVLLTPDNKTVILPNGGLSTGAMINFSKQSTRRVDFTFGIGYGDDIDKARDVIKSVIARHDKVLKNPAPFVGVVEHADSSINLVTRVWVNSADYWDVYFFMMEFVKKEFDAQGVNIPFPQRDIHIIKEA